MFVQLLLGGLFFTAGILTLIPEPLAEPARELALALLTTAAVLGAYAYVIRCHLDQPATDPTLPQENRP